MTLPLVLVPGLGCDGGLWRHQLGGLSDIADCSIGDTLQDDGIAGMADRILNAAPEKFALAGLSMGGYISFEIMRRAPERVVKLALLDTSARPDTPEATKNRHAAIDAVSKYDYATLARHSLAQLVADDATPEVKDAVVAMSVRVGSDTYVRQQYAIMARPDSRPTLAQILVPTMVLVGGKDILTPPEVAKEIHAGIAGSVLHVVAGSGHLSAIEAPDAVNRHMRDWLAAN